jgi:hypothetical protein
MNRSENINELAAALAKAQGAMKPADKSALNPFFKSKYADLGSVWESCRKALSDNGLAVLQGVTSTVDSVTVETTLVHASGQWFSESLSLPSKRDAQSIGSAATYARRYGLSAMLGIVADEDDDGNSAKPPEPQEPPKRKTEQRKPAKEDEQRKPVAVLDDTYTKAKTALDKATTESEITKLGGLIDDRHKEGKLNDIESAELVTYAISMLGKLKDKEQQPI